LKEGIKRSFTFVGPKRDGFLKEELPIGSKIELDTQEPESVESFGHFFLWEEQNKESEEGPTKKKLKATMKSTKKKLKNINKPIKTKLMQENEN
jgi:hypothetical protein